MTARDVCAPCRGRGYVHTGEVQVLEHRSLGLTEYVRLVDDCPYCHGTGHTPQEAP